MPKLKPHEYPDEDDDDLRADDGQNTSSNNSTENERANNAASDVGLTKKEERKFHEAITGKPPMSYEELVEIAKQIKDG